MSFPRDAILGNGFTSVRMACPISPDAKPKFNKITSPRPKIRTVRDFMKAELPGLWPQIEANMLRQNEHYRLAEPISNWENWTARELLSILFTWFNTPEGDDFWTAECQKK